MHDDEDDDDIRATIPAGFEVAMTPDPSREIRAVFDDLEALLKNGDVIAGLTARGVNASIALVAIEGLRAYLAGNKAQAAEDFGTVADEVGGRLKMNSA